MPNPKLSQNQIDTVLECAEGSAEFLWNTIICDTKRDHDELYREFAKAIAGEVFAALLGFYDDNNTDREADDILEQSASLAAGVEELCNQTPS